MPRVNVDWENLPKTRSFMIAVVEIAWPLMAASLKSPGIESPEAELIAASLRLPGIDSPEGELIATSLRLTGIDSPEGAKQESPGWRIPR